MAEITKNGGKALAVQANVAKEAEIRRLFGMIETEGLHAAGIAESDFRKQAESQTPLGRIGRPQDIATAAVFLASDDSDWVTGETLRISGGWR